ncbi:MAG: hypothetical protein N5P05_004647 (plasmid) [Chroococcopsis gigantea SAG 12.99]|jgi:hypothetical protein|nr:hypothetical protein [Chroococcopsis gigantea SAG 12.99]
MRVSHEKVASTQQYSVEPLHSAESILSALLKSIGKKNVIEPFDQSYTQSTLMIELAKTTKLARWAFLANF